jgi:hypothetical protein
MLVYAVSPCCVLQELLDRLTAAAAIRALEDKPKKYDAHTTAA